MKRMMWFLTLLAFLIPSEIMAQVTPGKSTLEAVKTRGKLIAGVRQEAPPWGYVSKDGQPAGFDVEVARYFAKKLGVELELVPVTAKTRITMLVNGNIDILTAGTAHSIERDDVIDFSISYYRGGTKFLVRKGSNIKSYRDLEGKTVGLAQGTPYQARLLQKQPKAKVTVFQEYPDAVLALLQGKIDAIMTAQEILTGLAKNRPEVEVVGSTTDFPFFTQGLGVRENDSKWRDWVNFTLIEMWKNGTIHELYRKHLDQDPDPDFQMETWEI
jgi:polar amino acid transport system substrate-binding protein